MCRGSIAVKVSAVLAAVMVFMCAVPFFAAVSAQECSLTVDIKDSDGKSVSGITVCIAKAAYIDVNGGYTAADSFSAFEIPPEELSDGGEDAALEAYEYIIESGVPYTYLTTDADGDVFFPQLDMGIYIVFGADGEDVEFEPYIVILPQIIEGVPVYDVYSEPKVSISSDVSYKSVSVTKIWNDNMDSAALRPDSIDAVLYLNGAEYARTELTADNGWRAVFSDLPEDGEYTISESGVTGVYTPEITGSESAGFVIMNTYESADPTPTPTPDTDDYYLAVSKVWDDDDDSANKRPTSVTVQLVEDGVVSATAVLNESNSWHYVFSGLDKDSEYTIKEITPTEYSASYSGSMAAGYVITNKYTEDTTDPGDIPDPEPPKQSEKASITVTKIWDDNDDEDSKRPESITVYLITGGSVYRSAELSENNGWTYTFEELPAGLAYTIMEEAAEDYTGTYSGSASEGFVITNTYTPGTTENDPPPTPSEPDPGITPTPAPSITPTSTPNPGSSPTSTPTAAPTKTPGHSSRTKTTDAPTSTPTSTSTTDKSSPTGTPTTDSGDPPSSSTGTPSNPTNPPSESEKTPQPETPPSDDTTPNPNESPSPSDNPPEDNPPTGPVTDPPDNPDENPPDEPEDEPTDKPDSNPPETLIPQTGNNYIPIYILSALGAVFVIAGAVELIIGSDEDE